MLSSTIKIVNCPLLLWDIRQLRESPLNCYLLDRPNSLSIRRCFITVAIGVVRPRRSCSAAAYSRQTFPWMICRSVRASVGRSVCPVHCGKTADRIRIPFGIVGRTGPGMRQVAGFRDPSTGRGTFVGEFGAHHCNQWELYGVYVRQRRDAALFPNYFGQTC